MRDDSGKNRGSDLAKRCFRPPPHQFVWSPCRTRRSMAGTKPRNNSSERVNRGLQTSLVGSLIGLCPGRPLKASEARRGVPPEPGDLQGRGGERPCSYRAFIQVPGKYPLCSLNAISGLSFPESASNLC